jgi:hypothetical protein
MEKGGTNIHTYIIHTHTQTGTHMDRIQYDPVAFHLYNLIHPNMTRGPFTAIYIYICIYIVWFDHLGLRVRRLEPQQPVQRRRPMPRHPIYIYIYIYI